MLSNKYSINNSRVLQVIWFLLLTACGLSILMAYILIDEFTNGSLSHIVPTKRHAAELFDKILPYLIFAGYLALLIISRLATFRRTDFIRLVEKLGVKLKRNYFYFWVVEMHRYVDGFLDDIYVIARMDFPFWAYSPFHRDVPPGGRDYSGPHYMKEEACVALYSLINGPYDFDVEIIIDGVKKVIPATGCPEIDSILNELLATESYFHAKLLFNKDCLSMSIIGGSWEGGRFGEKIEKGFEMFRRMNDALKARYPVADWNKWQVAWHDEAQYFYLEHKGA